MITPVTPKSRFGGGKEEERSSPSPPSTRNGMGADVSFSHVCCQNSFFLVLALRPLPAPLQMKKRVGDRCVECMYVPFPVAFVPHSFTIASLRVTPPGNR